MTTRTAMTTTRRIASAVLTLVIVVLVILLWPARFGGSTHWIIVAGNSMEPTYDLGDVVLTRSTTTPTVGDVVVFEVPYGVGEGSLVIHRIIGERDDGSFVMQGDNRDTADQWRVRPEHVVGTPLLRLPGFGKVVAAISSGALVAPALGLAVTIALWPRRRRDDPDRPTDHDPTTALERPGLVASPSGWRPEITEAEMATAREWLEQELRRIEQTYVEAPPLPVRPRAPRPQPVGAASHRSG
ncbi:MAG: signal peptidase I [Ilumatobacter sp.]|nr:MAG: signal peptidase I [Ilumatobacter sp.]